MCDKGFPGNLPPYAQLDPERREFLIEYYKRCEAFWRHWTPTIWSIPSVAAAINVGAFTLLPRSQQGVNVPLQAVVLGVLSVLNLALSVGVWKHRDMQKVFGTRILDIERYIGIPIIKLSPIQQCISGSWLYVALMFVLFLVSLGLLVYTLVVPSPKLF